MNKSRIEWTDYTWNPVSGCRHGCPYCYARRLSMRFSGDMRLNLADDRCVEYAEGSGMYVLKEPFLTADNRALNTPFGFAPTLYEYRMQFPQEIKNGANLFVCSMGDLFGEWVPEKWILRVFDACGKSPQHNYLFLTKNPVRYEQLRGRGLLPKKENMWYGTTVTTPDKPYFTAEGYRTFLSIEPMQASFAGKSLPVDWVIVGAETGQRKEKIVPQRAWIEDVAAACKKAGIPLFMKDSLEAVMDEELRREFPVQLRKRTLSPKLKKRLYAACCVCKTERRKQDMNTMLCHVERGKTARPIAYVCRGCMDEFRKRNGLEDETWTED